MGENNSSSNRLEEKHYLKCCIHYRNFAPGVLYRENMVDRVYKSRKIVAVVSRNFLTVVFAKLIKGNGYETWQTSLLYVFVCLFGLDPAQTTTEFGMY